MLCSLLCTAAKCPPSNEMWYTPTTEYYSAVQRVIPWMGLEASESQEYTFGVLFHVYLRTLLICKCVFCDPGHSLCMVFFIRRKCKRKPYVPHFTVGMLWKDSFFKKTFLSL